MLPKTLPGFLMLAGLLMFLASMFLKYGGIEWKGFKLPRLEEKDRRILKTLGIAFMIISFLLYASGTPPLMMMLYQEAVPDNYVAQSLPDEGQSPAPAGEQN